MLWNLLKKMLNPASQVAKLITPLFIQIGLAMVKKILGYFHIPLLLQGKAK
jgi:hypothetical protein